jgi:hypothetical protein
MLFKKKYNYFLILIFISSLFSIMNMQYNLVNYDKNIILEDNKTIHRMIKNDNLRYFSHGDEIKNKLKNNVNYFETGRNNFTKYLYPRLIALYYLIFDYDLYENNENETIKIGVHKNFLYFQILLYYSSIAFLYFQLKNKFDLKLLFFSIFFLCLEPTIFQYHGSFWSESIFFSLQILIMGLVLNNKSSSLRFFFIGILLSLLALQRTNGFFYIIPIIIYFFYVKEFNFFKKISFLILGFILLINFVGYHNYKKSGEYHVIPKETKAVLHAYVITSILDKEDLLSEKKKTLELIKSKNLDIDYDELKNIPYRKYSFKFCHHLNKGDTNLKELEICKYLNKRSKTLVLLNPINSFNFVIKRSLTFSLLNPFHIYSDHKFLSGKSYYKSDLHNKLLPYRVVYSFIIYVICLIGLIYLYKKKNKKLLFYIIISSLYFFSILSWHGNNRYFTPILIYISFLFSGGFLSILNYFFKKKYLKS